MLDDPGCKHYICCTVYDGWYLE